MRKSIKFLFYFLLLASLVFVIYFWWQGSGALFTANEAGMLTALGRLAGLLAAYFVLLQLVLIGRPRWLEPVFGLDRLSRIHHLNGEFLILFILLHPIFLSFGYGLSGNTPFFAQLWSFITGYEDVLPAAFAVLLFLFIVGYSIYLYKANIKYEFWYFTHLFTYLAIILAFNHQLGLGGDFISSPGFTAYWYALYAFAFGNIIIFRFMLPAYKLQKHRFVVAKIETETKDVTSVYITGQKMEMFKVKPGQFMIFRFLDNKFWWQAHPFSLSGICADNSLRISIKNSGDFTSQISQLKPGTRVVIDGPHGIFTKDTASKSNILMIAGGIGITPIISLTEQLAKEGKNLVLLYANRIEPNIAFRKELEDLAAKYNFPVIHVLSQQPNFAGEKGYIDKEKIHRLVPDAKEREVFLCGPGPMMKKILADLQALGVKPSAIHFEQFSL